MQAAGFGGVGIAGGNAAIGRAGPDRHAGVGQRRQSLDEIEHGPPGPRQAVELSRAIGPAQDRALDAENIEFFVAALDALENLQDLGAGLLVTPPDAKAG